MAKCDDAIRATLRHTSRLYLYTSICLPLYLTEFLLDKSSKRYHLTLQEKVDIIQFYTDHSAWSIRSITQALSTKMNRSFGKTTIRNIIKNKDAIISSSKVRRLDQVRVTVSRRNRLEILDRPDSTDDYPRLPAITGDHHGVMTGTHTEFLIPGDTDPSSDGLPHVTEILDSSDMPIGNFDFVGCQNKN